MNERPSPIRIVAGTEHKMPNADHKFRLGQRVHLLARPWDLTPPAGHFRVMRLLPREGAEHQYRIQSVADGHERVVRESQLA
ncbi:MAG: hypothetical protein ACYC1L_10085 [Alphaproteobacteria bacterium]